MVMLEERDDHIDRYLFITGLGKRGYYISRIVIPAFGALAVTVILLPIFGLTDLSFLEIFFLALAGTLQGIIIALMVIRLSSNKLEGMAITKFLLQRVYGYLCSKKRLQPISINDSIKKVKKFRERALGV